jgi:opacity protein-like surface antigen
MNAIDVFAGYTDEMTRFLLVALHLLALSATAAAQDRPAAFVGGSVSVANTDGRTESAFAGSFGYRFSRVVSFVMEATLVPNIHSDFADKYPVVLTTGASSGAVVQIFPTPYYNNPGGRIVLFTNAARIDIPTSSARLTPFFTAGGGIANTRRTADFIYPVPYLGQATPPIPIDLRPITQHVTSTSTDLALTLGGGAGIRITSSFWLDVDLRIFRLMGQEDRNLGRFGAGARYTF